MDTYTFRWKFGPTASLIVEMIVRHTNASTNSYSERKVISSYRQPHVTVRGLGTETMSVSIVDMPAEYISAVVLEIMDRHAEIGVRERGHAEAEAAVKEAHAALDKARALVDLHKKE